MRYGTCEIFYTLLSEQTKDTCYWLEDVNEPIGEGWFYWCCSPGCLPEGDPIGPFTTESDAKVDAIDNGFMEE